MNLGGNYEPTAAFLLAWAAKATVLFGVAWVAAFCLREHSAALRHRVWAIAIVSSLALPLVSFSVPAWYVVSRPAAATQMLSQTALVMNSAAVPVPVAPPNDGFDIETLIAAGVLIWVLGTMLVVLKLLVGLVRLWRMSSYSTIAAENSCATLNELRELFRIKRSVRLLESASATTMPMTWGVFRPRVVLPSVAACWDAERRRIVLSHELAHVLRNDWLLQFCAEVLRACFWFHPLAWIAAHRLRQESERACDDAVLNSGIAAPEYASQLLALAKTLKTPSWRFSLALAVARPSNLERRFAAMLNSSISRRPLSRKGNLIAISLGACLLLPLAALTLSAEAARATAPVAAPAQSNTTLTNQPIATGDGSISGTIIDHHGSGILGADITLTSNSAQIQRKTTTSADGRFLFAQLPPGMYVVNIERRGLLSGPSRNIHIILHDRAMAATIRLALGDGVAASPLAPSSHASDLTPVTNVTSAPTPQSGPAASISGSVGDPSGAVIPRANVTLTDVATGQQQQIATDPVGEFSFSNLIPDGYELSIAQPGFQVFNETIQLSPSEQVELPELLLRVGDVSQTIEITASRTAPARAQMPTGSAVPVLACSAQTTQAVQPASKDPVQSGPEPRRTRVGGMVEATRLIQQSVPVYPESARAAGVQGTVVFNTVIGKDGSLLSPCVVNSKVDPALVQSAIAAISQWRYSPALLNGEPIEVATQISVVYSLTN